MTKNLLVILFINLSLNICYSQQQDISKTFTNNGISKPSILSAHPLGIFFSRIQGNFNFKAFEKTRFSINVESGNVWGTPIKVYIPNNKSVRDEVRTHQWHQAQYFFNPEELNAKTFSSEIDGVIKGLRIHSSFKLKDEHEISIGLRIFALSKGKIPFSFITNDDFLESFHKNIAGGNDPFDRGVYGHNRALIKYTDRNGNSLKLENNDLFFGGLESTYYYYPKKLSTDTFSTNLGTHLGLNFSNYNKSIDFGISINSLKVLRINELNYFQIGFGIGTLRKSLLNFKKDNLDLGTNDFLANIESAIEYNFISKKLTKHSFGLDYYLQTSLNKRDELEYAILIRHPDAHNAWGHGVTNLYKRNNYWTLFYSFTKKITTTIYLQQDFEVNNNPDLQTGVRISFNLN